MRHNQIYFFLILFCFSIFTSCKNDKSKKPLPGYTGNAGEIVVVAKADELRSSLILEALSNTFLRNIPGLPQPEPEFDVVRIPKKDFSRIFQLHRNILIFEIDKLNDNKIHYLQNQWAKGQKIVEITASSVPQAVKLLEENSENILNYFKFAEIERLIERNKKLGNKEVENQLKKQFNISLTIQKDAYLAKQDSNFAWVRIERVRKKGGYDHRISQGLILFEIPYRDTAQLNLQYLTHLKDSITKKQIPGPTEGSYMTTSYKLEKPFARKYQLKNKYVTEIRGLWRVEGNFMGGPFVHLAIVDEKNSRIVNIVGYVYAPQFNKRDYLREIEAMLYSFEL
ncbi:MAG: DUF4837 family protein [Bacteroidetes bacterium]|nr:MAG: DUF4837 family protein [Bacteroidota bacterium]